jgi:hypothetical protein
MFSLASSRQPMKLESVTFTAGPLTLEGVLHIAEVAAPRPGVVVCHPHPLYGGDMNNSVVIAICESLAESGISALRFDFRGAGGSEGSFGGGVEEPEDVRAALDFLETRPSVQRDRLGVAGYSFGANVALSTADERVRALVAVSPPLSMGGGPLRLHCPALFVFGERDAIAPADALSKVAPASSAEQETVIIPGADHFWAGKADEAAAQVADFFRRKLRAAGAQG